MSRISVSFGDEFSVDLETLSNIYVKAPDGGTLFNMYDDVDYGIGGEPIPVLNGLSQGIIFQNYVDIRQNGSIFKQLIKNELKYGFNSSFSGFVPGYSINELLSGNPDDNSEYNDFEQLLTNYLPLCNNTTPFNTTTPARTLESILSGVHTIPGYSQLFFTKATEAAPNATNAIPYADFDIDSVKDYISRFEPQDKTDWRQDYYQTQGKISINDFDKFYFNMLNDPSAPLFNPLPLLKNNGPKTYYKKISAGVRMCLVLSYKSGVDTFLTALVTRYILTLREIHNGKTSVEAREIMKDKIGVYKNESGENFLVIPLMQKEKDFLENLNNQWLQDNENFEWWSDINFQIKNHFFAGQKSKIRIEFEKLYPSNAFAQILPLAVRNLILEEYGEELQNLFGTTKEEILQSIFIAKSIINGDWDAEFITKGTGTGNLSIDSNSIYLSLVLSLIPLIIQLLATFIDPTWKTPWFTPGPITPVGFLAKILSVIDENT